MKFKITKEVPSRDELLEFLQKNGPQEYTYKSFGFGPGKSVIARKSGLVGARVWSRPKKQMIYVNEHIPNPLIQGLFGGLLLWLIVRSKAKPMIQQLSELLKKEYE